ncbi:ribonuclease HII [Sphingomicrobium sediminis]|uniref:Ribonuclease HII n=1 Tax=Sphingomicrobium sediminis TaxID=2950949 RepID=A0A9X2EH60_9SPHN|nr:ribonuclease HII [Sphingomicrobium sediminis]
MIVGVDEAGRGPLAGPVVAAAVFLCGTPIRGLDDSKKLTGPKRAILRARIEERCTFGIGIASVAEIDELNILRATMLAMTRAVEALCDAAGAEPIDVLIDGDKTPERWCDQWRWPARAIIGGDGREKCIGAASILAKETRDELMVAAEDEHPGYGFARHKGYGTAAHMEALREKGPCALHRRSFAPVSQISLI